MSKLLEEYFTEQELAEELKRTPRMLAAWRQQRKGPAWTKVGRKILYHRDAVARWLRDQQVEPARARPDRPRTRAAERRLTP